MQYKVKSQDTLDGIAQHFSTTVEEIRRLNRMAGRTQISTGQILRMPDELEREHIIPSDVEQTYPGDTASKPSIAKWMGNCAKAWGLPPELPIMCSLVHLPDAWEPYNRNVREAWGYLYSSPDIADRAGYFGHNPFHWGCRREGQKNCTYVERRTNLTHAPHAISEFLDAVLTVKGEWVQDGSGNWYHCMNGYEDAYGAWCQAAEEHVEREFDSEHYQVVLGDTYPARHYQAALPRARELLQLSS